MSNFKMIFKMYREIIRLDKKILPVAFLNAVITATKPFVNIYFTAKIVSLLANGADFKSIISYIIVAVILGFAFNYAGSLSDDYYQVLHTTLYDKEDFKMAEKIFHTEYEALEDNHFRETIHKHEEASASRWARFSYYVWTSQVFISGVYTLAVSIIMIMPLLKIGFTKTGETFFEKPIFLISLIGVIAVMGVVMLLIAIKINKSYLEANEAYATLDRLFYSFIGLFADYKTGKEIRVYKEQELISHIATDKILTDGEDTLKKISMRTAKTSSFVAIMGAMVAFGVYVFIGVKGNFGLFSIGSLVMYCGAFMQIINGIMQIANTLGKLAEILPLAKVYFEIIEHEDNKEYGTAELNSDTFEIEFKNVSFKYPSASTYALENINLTVKNGERLAVVGRNGSGKTTFIKLMCRLYDATDGEILINGINVKEYSKQSIVKLYSVVFQDFQIFSIPLKDNICAGDDCDTNRLHICLENSNVLERAMQMPEKENTYLYKDISENGVEISGGEAQKLALARALYKDSPVVILDEPTAALDPLAENEIYNRFNSFVDNKTAIYISHRLSSCIFCNRIAVFDKARLVETGTHQELLNKNGKYSELWNAQAQYYIS